MNHRLIAICLWYGACTLACRCSLAHVQTSLCPWLCIEISVHTTTAVRLSTAGQRPGCPPCVCVAHPAPPASPTGRSHWLAATQCDTRQAAPAVQAHTLVCKHAQCGTVRARAVPSWQMNTLGHACALQGTCLEEVLWTPSRLASRRPTQCARAKRGRCTHGKARQGKATPGQLRVWVLVMHATWARLHRRDAASACTHLPRAERQLAPRHGNRLTVAQHHRQQVAVRVFRLLRGPVRAPSTRAQVAGRRWGPRRRAVLPATRPRRRRAAAHHPAAGLA